MPEEFRKLEKCYFRGGSERMSIWGKDNFLCTYRCQYAGEEREKDYVKKQLNLG